MDEKLKQAMLLDSWKESGERFRAQAEYNRREQEVATSEGRPPNFSHISREEFARQSAVAAAAFLMGESAAAASVESVWKAHQPKVGDERKGAGVFQVVIVAVNDEARTSRAVVDFRAVNFRLLGANACGQRR